MCGTSSRTTRQEATDQDLEPGKSREIASKLHLDFYADCVSRFGTLFNGFLHRFFVLLFLLKVEPLLDADARQLSFKPEMEKRRKAMRADSATQAVLAGPEVAPTVEMTAKEETPQVRSISLSHLLLSRAGLM
jgi:hypothetical protein